MREIKFRAKDMTNNWCYGQLIIGNNYDFIITKSDYDEVVATLSTLVCQCHPIKKGSASIGQFTGLQDKNGKEIYEGDIVKLDKQLFKVVYDCANFGLASNKGVNYNPIINKSKEAGSMDFRGCYCDNFVSLFELYWNFNDDEDILSEIEIIGNIYDNPELVKGE